jgi:flagellar motor switch protein FliM
MTNGNNNIISLPNECKACDNWADINNPVRIHTVFTTLLDKIEDKVMSEEFKPTTGDLMKVWDAVQSLEMAKGPGETKVQWSETEVSTN